jgi:hypothetical protein
MAKKLTAKTVTPTAADDNSPAAITNSMIVVTTVLPENMRSLAIEFAEQRLLWVDYIAATIITACLAAIASRARLLTFEGDAKPMVAFATGQPGRGKSSAICVIEKPFSDFDRAWQKTHRFGAYARAADVP